MTKSSAGKGDSPRNIFSKKSNKQGPLYHGIFVLFEIKFSPFIAEIGIGVNFLIPISLLKVL